VIGYLPRVHVTLDTFFDLFLSPFNLVWCEVLVTVFTTLNLLPSMATASCVKSFRSRHMFTKRRHTLRIPSPLPGLNSAIVLTSGARRPVSDISSTLRWHSRSRRRLERTRL
jgi:hypothetical protein